MSFKKILHIIVLMFVAATMRSNAQAIENSYSSGKDSLERITKSFNTQKDSLQKALHHNVSSIDSVSSSYQNKIDSLSALQLPATKYTAKLDSIKQLQTDIVKGFNNKLDSIKSKTLGKVKALNLPPELTDQTEQNIGNLNELDFPFKEIKKPNLDLGQISSPQELNKIQSLGNVPKVELPDELGKMKDLPDIKGNVDPYRKNIEAWTQKDGKGLEQLSKTAESKVSNIKEVQALQKQTGALKESSNLGSSQAFKEKMMLEAKQKAGDHFKGKEIQLNEAIAKTDKYKQKYSDIPSIKDIENKKPNEMRGKPWFERLVPGIALQTFRKHNLMADINPYVGYRLSGNLTWGIGWNQRIVYNTSSKKFTSSEIVYGFRTYLEYKAFKGFSLRLEPEYLNALVPYSISARQTDQRQREWVFSTFAGIKKGYKFFGNVKGTIFVFYNLYDPHNKSPYSERLNVRFGFEYLIKHKQKAN